MFESGQETGYLVELLSLPQFLQEMLRQYINVAQVVTSFPTQHSQSTNHVTSRLTLINHESSQSNNK
jgi:hypothetical protein